MKKKKTKKVIKLKLNLIETWVVIKAQNQKGVLLKKAPEEIL
jgi:hypothetical protein